MKNQETRIDRTAKLAYSPTEICEYYDQNPDITLADLSVITMRSVKELKRILMGGSR